MMTSYILTGATISSWLVSSLLYSTLLSYYETEKISKAEEIRESKQEP